ncbi:MAG: glutamyl-tRNA reductase [Candidatus Lumbricidophila eiseniae]|uniref:Glutamyl-tRNA reductase n=1 Tax=Candidatus Lumbricidiphila eiseniae TaxID=1969409 RepID=A0A2A6FV75_9MICO|nr:MAG: glutamyl-tRNA reductase [Candidatus Lumbricidophila eiseniae]
MLLCLTANHKNAEFSVLERLSERSEHAARRLVTEHPAVRGAVVVSTCNRFEVYIDVAPGPGHGPIAACPVAGLPNDGLHAGMLAVAELTELTFPELVANFHIVQANAVAEHLFAVASGLESVVVGEGEISGQVRRALEQARAEHATTPELERLFQRASTISREVRNETGIGSAGRSLVRLALDLAEGRVTDWTNTRILLVGTGQYAGATLAALRERGAHLVRVYSPSGRAAKFAASHALEPVASSDAARAMANAEVVITCTTADHHVIDAPRLANGRAQLRELTAIATTGTLSAAIHPHDQLAERQLLIDLGLPRNIDPAVAHIAGVELLDLETIRIHAPLEEITATEHARNIVARAARDHREAREELDVTPVVVALRHHVFDILDREITRATRRGDADGAIESALRHMAGVLLHTPMVRSREFTRAGKQRAWVEGVQAVFGVTADELDASTTGAHNTAGRIGWARNHDIPPDEAAVG